VRSIYPNNLGIWLDVWVPAKAITDHRAKFENMLQGLGCGSNVRTTKLDIDFECKIIAILVASPMQLACSNDLRNYPLFDISPLLDGSTELSRLRNDNQHEADSWGPRFTVRVHLPGPVLPKQVFGKKEKGRKNY